MANPIIVPKKSTVAAKVPTTSDLALGEICINHADAKLYARHPSSGAIQEIGGGGSTSGGVAGSTGSTDNAILRADGTGGATLQTSDLVVDDATTATQANVALVNNHSETNSALVLTPKGTGALIAGPKPDGTSTGGNARGANAIDLQTSRSSATQVAGAQGSVVIGYRNTVSTTAPPGSVAIGYQNTASGGSFSAIALGTSCTASGTSSFAVGRNNVASGSYSASFGSFSTASALGAFSFYALADRYGMLAQSSGGFVSNGDAQRARFVMRNKTTTDTATELFLNGSSTRLTIPSGKIFAFTINISGVKSDGSAVAHYLRQYCLKNVSGTTSEVYAPVTIGTDNAAGTSIALSANDTNDALKVEVTGIASETWRWVAAVDAVEIKYGS